MRVLIIDDRLARLRQTATLVEFNPGCQAVRFCWPERAVAWLAKEIPDQVLVELDMALIDGIEMLDCIRGDPRLAKVPVFLVADHLPAHIQMMARTAGVTGFLVRPILPDRLRQVLVRQ